METSVRSWVLIVEQGRLNSIGDPGQSNALRPLLARGYTNFNVGLDVFYIITRLR